MKKSFQLIPATLLCLIFSCQARNKTPVDESPSADSLSAQSSLPAPMDEAENSSFLSEDAETTPPYWDSAKLSLSDVDKSRKLISFTFDDAPSKTLENILAVFAAFNERHPACKASATFFCNGGRIDEASLPLLHVAYALGFELGNHTYSHANLATLTKEEIASEIDRTDKILSSVDGQSRHLFRAPYGKLTQDVKAVARTPVIDWTIDTLDWTGSSEQEIYDSVFNRRFSGAIVLMHDGYKHTVSALKRLLPDLAADGYQVVSVSKMAKAHGCKLLRGGVYIRARKQ